jgi:hypothetical protein
MASNVKVYAWLTAIIDVCGSLIGSPAILGKIAYLNINRWQSL